MLFTTFAQKGTQNPFWAIRGPLIEKSALYANPDRCHSFWPTYSIDVILEGKRKGKKPLRKEMGYGVFPDVNRIGRSKEVTSIPILLGPF